MPFSFTRIVRVPSTTCALVMMKPSSETTIPDPVLRCFERTFAPDCCSSGCSPYPVPMICTTEGEIDADSSCNDLLNCWSAGTLRCADASAGKRARRKMKAKLGNTDFLIGLQVLSVCCVSGKTRIAVLDFDVIVQKCQAHRAIECNQSLSVIHHRLNFIGLCDRQVCLVLQHEK